MNLWVVYRLLVETGLRTVDKLTPFRAALNSQWITAIATWTTFCGFTCKYHV